MPNESDLESYFSDQLSTRLLFSVATTEIPATDLCEPELEKLSEMRHESRRASWLKGRQALKSLIAKLSLITSTPSYDSAATAGAPAARRLLTLPTNPTYIQIDTTKLPVPHPCLSLTHSVDLAIAVASVDISSGLGIDLESNREVRAATTRFYLNETEHKQISSITSPIPNDDLLRLWTAKESLFKSDLKNKDMTILKYAMEDARKLTGSASIQINGEMRHFKYASKKFDQHWLTVSIAV